MLVKQEGEPGGGLAGPQAHGAPRGPAGRAGRVPFRGQAPAIQEELHLLGRKRPDHKDVRLRGQRSRKAEGPGGDHEVVARIGGDLPLDPVGNREAVVVSGDLIKAVEQDQAPAAAELALPPATGFLARRAADRGPYDIRQRDRWIGDDRLGLLAQREQDGDPPPAQVPAHGCPGAAAGRMGKQGALAASGLADQREDHPRAAVE